MADAYTCLSCTLVRADQGSLLQTLSVEAWEKIGTILRMPDVRMYTELEGDFNMLHAIVQYMRHHQQGRGITGVSHMYGAEIGKEIALFKGIDVLGHPNPMLESARPKVPDGMDLLEHKRQAKRRCQVQLGLEVNEDATLLSFVGRWALEKGIDLIADIVPWLLDEFPTLQIYICGPIGDAAGVYAASKLVSLASIPSLKPRLFVKAEFFRVTEEMRFAADFTLCPSRTEPFGYVDVEFAWHGCPTMCEGVRVGLRVRVRLRVRHGCPTICVPPRLRLAVHAMSRFEAPRHLRTCS